MATNQDSMLFSDFRAYCNTNGYVISDADQTGFQTKTCAIHKIDLQSPAPLEEWKHYFFNHYKLMDVYFYVNNMFVDYGPLPQLQPFPAGVQLDAKGHPIDPEAGQDPDADNNTPDAIDGVTIDSNSVQLSLTQFRDYVVSKGLKFSDDDLTQFQATTMKTSNLGTRPYPVEMWKHYFFHHFRNLQNCYFYWHVNGQQLFVDMGPLPQLQALPAGLPLDANGQPINSTDD